MLDTVMALWNQNSRNRGFRLFLTSSLVCVGLSLFLVTIIIPGWILLFTQNSGTMTAVSLNGTAVATASAASVGRTPESTPVSRSASRTKKASCMHSLPTPGPHHTSTAPDNGRNADQTLPARVNAPQSIASVPTTGAKVMVMPHEVYAGRPRGAISHLQKDLSTVVPSSPTKRRVFPTPVAQPTLTPTPSPAHSMRRAAIPALRPDAVVAPVQNIGKMLAPLLSAANHGGGTMIQTSDECSATDQGRSIGLGITDLAGSAPELSLSILPCLVLLGGGALALKRREGRRQR